MTPPVLTLVPYTVNLAVVVAIVVVVVFCCSEKKTERIQLSLQKRGPQ